MKAQAPERVGAAIRKLRLAKGWTLAQLSAETAIPLSTLSRVELGQNTLRLENLTRLCRALEVDLQGLVAREAEAVSVASGRRSVTRAGTGLPMRFGPHQATIGADDLIDRALTPVTLEVSVTTLEAHGPLLTIQGELYVAVQSGAVVVHSQFYAPLELAAGDAVYMDGRAAHAILASGGETARVLMVVAGDWPPPNPARFP